MDNRDNVPVTVIFNYKIFSSASWTYTQGHQGYKVLGQNTSTPQNI